MGLKRASTKGIKRMCEQMLKKSNKSKNEDHFKNDESNKVTQISEKLENVNKANKDATKMAARHGTARHGTTRHGTAKGRADTQQAAATAGGQDSQKTSHITSRTRKKRS